MTRLLLEKVPLFALCLVSIMITLLAQRGGGAIDTLARLPLTTRIGNSIVSYVVYLGKTLVPHSLPIFNPHPRYELISVEVIAASIVLIAITLIVWHGTVKRPYLLVGWLWYVGTLVPVIGLVQVGAQGLAYRYTYVPMIGIYLIVVLVASEFAARTQLAQRLLPWAAAATLGVLMVLTWAHLGRWRDSETLFTYALAMTKDNYLAHNNLGVHLLSQERNDEAIPHFQEALRLRPQYRESLRNLGLALHRIERYEEAVDFYTRYLQLNENDPVIHRELALALTKLGRDQEAAPHYSTAVRLQSDNVPALIHLGSLQTDLRRYQEAMETLNQALRLEPGNPKARYYLGYAYYRAGQLDKAAELLDAELQLEQKQQLGRLTLLGLISLQQENYERAAEIFRACLEQSADSTDLLERLANVEYTNLKQYPQAHGHFERLLELRPDHPNRSNINRVIEYLKPRVAKPAQTLPSNK